MTEPMAGSSLEVVESSVGAIFSGDLDAWADHYAEDAHYRAIEGAPDDRGPIRGREEIKNYLGEWFEMFDGFRIEPLEAFEVGEDKVIAVVRFGGRAKLSGIEADQTAAILYTVRHGKIAEGREFATREEAVAAAGLSE